MNIDYDLFQIDIDKTITPLMDEYGFIEKKGANTFEKLYQNGIWMIEISMTKLFPYVSVSYTFFDSETNQACKNEIIEKILGIKKEDLLSHYKDFKSRIGFESYYKEMMYVCESLEKFYKPILTGEFTCEDYKKFETLEEK
ncbi:hypothetical protein [Tenacibaculum sp. C7A-26P2]|uniref:hypothetical protein n=1 Tax=Tenacibaculum sp. C7A-26P2 TaxID=3447504 RepID=UPI003F870505